MPILQHFKWFFKYLFKGADRDSDPEITGASEDAVYFDSFNGRTTSVEGGEGGAWKKINGEELKYENKDNNCLTGTGLSLSDSYKCLYSGNFFLDTDYIIEIWADSNKVLPSLIRINGVIVLKSSAFPITVDFPPQCVINESCIGGEIYITDFNSPPIIFNFKDMMVNGGMLLDDDGNTICTDKYFGSFSLSEYILELNIPNDHPIFIKTGSSIQSITGTRQFTFGSGGLNVGIYQYSFRYVAANGDKTKWVVTTPPIPIVISISNASVQYPFIRTFSKDPGSPPSTNGIQIMFRISNLLNYDEIEIKRVKYTTGQVLGTPGIEEVLSDKIAIDHGEISIANVFDYGSIGAPITEEEAESSFSSVEAAKTLRYFDNRLFLMNIKYSSRDIQGQITFADSPNGNKMYPYIQKIYKAGHNDPYNFVYLKAFLHGEKYGFAIAGFDGLGERSFAIPITGFDNYQYPNRREEISADTLAQSGTTVTAADSNNTVKQTHEVFDLVNAIQKTDKCNFKNISDFGLNHVLQILGGKGKNKLDDDGCPDPTAAQVEFFGGNYFNPFNRVFPFYSPFHPTAQMDSDITGHNYRTNLYVNKATGIYDQYQPKGFSPDYYAAGMKLHKVTNIPSHIQSFSVLRSKPAKRIFCQGIGMYSIIEGIPQVLGGLVNLKLATKHSDHLWFYSPDTDQNTGTVDMTTVINDIAAGSSRYKIELVSPLGFFSEVYNFDQQSAGRDRKIDMISYARILFEDGSINIGDNVGNVGIAGYTGYDKWRNQTQIPNPETKKIFGLNAVNSITEPTTRSTYFELVLDNGLYATLGTGMDTSFNPPHFDETPMRNFHEPFYIVNIIDTAADVITSNIDEYLETGTFQKVTAIIGKSDGIPTQSYLLVDERINDCMSNIAADDKVVFIRRPNTTSDEAWLDITNKANQAQEIADIDAGTKTVTFNGNTIKIYGVYKHTITTPTFASALNPDTSQRFAYINFSNSFNPGSYSQSLFVPVKDSLIKVKYDESVPIAIFGGDVTVGEAVFAPLDRASVNGQSVGDEFLLSLGWPYYKWKMNPRYYIAKNISLPIVTGAGVIQDVENVGLDYIRQMIIMFCCESRINIPYAYNDEIPPNPNHDRHFPLVHYIMRPMIWDAANGQCDDGSGNDVESKNAIADQYFVDYPGECVIWTLGGFRFIQMKNIDYSHEPETQKHSTKPKVGFKEKTNFCSQIIWSDPRATNLIDDPGVRTFPALNFFDISDDTGEIKFGWNTMLDKRGSNLYAFTEHGICLLMTNKRSLHELTGGQLAVMGTDETNVVLEQVWISKVIGMNDETWRSKGEWDNILFFTNKQSSYLFNGSELADLLKTSNYFSRINKDFLTFLKTGYQDDIMGVYDTRYDEYWVGIRINNRTFTIPIIAGYGGFTYGILYLYPHITTLGIAIDDNIINDEVIEVTGILSNGYIYLPYNLPIGSYFYICFGGQVNVYNLFNSLNVNIYNAYSGQCIKITHTSYILNVTDTWSFQIVTDLPERSKVFAYSAKNKRWMGSYDYDFDKYVSFKNKTFGSREMETYQLHRGFKINGESIKGKLIQVFSPDTIFGKEFIRVKINSDKKPSKIKFFFTKDQVESDTPICEIDSSLPNALRDRDGFEQYVPRQTTSPNRRVQSRMIYVAIEHEAEEDFRITNAGVQFKRLK